MKEFVWSLDFFIRVAERAQDVTVLLTEENKLLVEVSSAAGINAIASMTNWCIKSNGYFNDYTNGSQKQFIVFDFDIDQNDSNCIIGITATTEESTKRGKREKAGLIKYMHNKYDGNMLNDKSILKRLDYIIEPNGKYGYYFVDLYKMYGKERPGIFRGLKRRIKRFFDPID